MMCVMMMMMTMVKRAAENVWLCRPEAGIPDHSPAGHADRKKKQMCWKCLDILADSITADVVVDGLLREAVAECTSRNIVVSADIQGVLRAVFMRWFGESKDR